MLRFECTGVREDGEKVYRLVINGETVREDLTLDEVVEAINRRDEERLGEERGTKRLADEGIGPDKRRRDDGA